MPCVSPFISRTSKQRLSAPPLADCLLSVVHRLAIGCFMLSSVYRILSSHLRTLGTLDTLAHFRHFFCLLSPVFLSLTITPTLQHSITPFFPHFFLSTLLSPILIVSCVMSKYSRRGMVYFLEAPVMSLNWGVSISPFSFRTATSLSLSCSITSL